MGEDHERTNIPCLDGCSSFREIQCAYIHGSCNQLGRQFTAPLERNVSRHGLAKTLCPEEHGQVIDGSCLGSAKFYFVAISHSGNKLLRSLVGAGLTVDHQDLGVIRPTGNRCHFINGQTRLSFRHGDRVSHGKSHDRVSVGRARLEIIHCRCSAAATLVDHNHVLLQRPSCTDHHHP